MNEIQKPPRDLSPESSAWFKEIVNTFELEISHIKLLTLACRAWDQAIKARADLKKNGSTYTDKHGVRRPAPEVVMERNATVLFARLLRELRLDSSPDETERIPRNRTIQQRKIQ